MQKSNDVHPVLPTSDPAARGGPAFPPQGSVGTAPTAALPAAPSRINIGSGKSFDPGYLNVDVDPYWNPDVVADLNQPIPEDGIHQDSDRFGPVALRWKAFDEILAADVLEHVADLPMAMTNCLNLLKVGGVFRISVPYELSLGAWSDPTHVRAFNERSWVYYCEWSWYLGWYEHCFRMQAFDAIPSDFGRDLHARGATLDELLRTPRAVDSMYVELVKVETTDAQKRECEARRGRGS